MCEIEAKNLHVTLKVAFKALSFGADMVAAAKALHL